MAQIKTRKTQAGDLRHTAYIRIKRKGVVVHQESRTFHRRAQAVEWSRRREIELAEPNAVALAKMGDVAIGALIQRYIDEFESTARWARTKAASLRQLRGTDIAKHSALDVRSERLVQHVRERRAGGAGPATAMNDLIWLGVVFRTARGAWGVPANVAAVTEAREVARQLRLISKAKQRDRVPTYEELEQLDAYFARQDKRSKVPMRHIMWFAIYSARRDAEICRILRADNEEDRRLGLVRDAKHPEGSEGNHRRFRYTEKGWQIANMQPESEDGRIFPYDSKTVSTRFTRACKVLAIEDLHFHDLRREATTRLFEQGMQIPEVAAHTLHESWSSLKVYVNLIKRGRILDAPFLSGSCSTPSAPPRAGRRGARPGR